jgi:hypothetical protein
LSHPGGGQEVSCADARAKVLLAKKASAKALRQEYIWHIQRISRSLLWLEISWYDLYLYCVYLPHIKAI